MGQFSNKSARTKKLRNKFTNRLLSVYKFRKSPLDEKWSDRFFNSPPRLILFSFLFIIIIGSILLSLPQAVKDRQAISYLDALFTSTSATCVTGLIIADTGSKFSVFGQVVILILIQAGGLGIMTFSTFFIFMLSGKLRLSQRGILINTFSQSPTAEIGRLLKTIFVFSLLIEFIGWILLSIRFSFDFPVAEAMYQGLFHSVSAFCNAGFSLFPDSFIGYQHDMMINLILMMLIIFGGLGYIVIYDLYKNVRSAGSWEKFRLSLHSKVVISSTCILIVAGMVFILGLEFENSLKDLSLSGKFLVSLFQSVTSRTAGFNSVSMSSLSNATLFIIIILMFIGASPGSCGGGIKTTTFTILLASIISRVKGQQDINIFRKRIPESTVFKLVSIIFLSMSIVILFTLLLMITEIPLDTFEGKKGMFMEGLFETVSAFGTVGLSMGLTSELGATGKMLVTVLMFIGRLGPLTMALAISGRPKPRKFHYLKEEVMIG